MDGMKLKQDSALPLAKWAHVCAVYIPGEKVVICILMGKRLQLGR